MKKGLCGVKKQMLRPFHLHLLVVRLQVFRVLPFPKVLLNVIRVRIGRQVVVRQAPPEGGEFHSPFFLQAVRGLLQGGTLQLQVFRQDFFERLVEILRAGCLQQVRPERSEEVLLECAPTSGERGGMAVRPYRWART
jgi:hypothetical protein